MKIYQLTDIPFCDFKTLNQFKLLACNILLNKNEVFHTLHKSLPQ